MHKYWQVLITWILFAFTITVNALSAILPLNGKTPGAISDMYPNRFVPDGATFSIWSIIYIGLIAFSAYASWALIKLPVTDKRLLRLQSVLPLFWLTCLLNAGWLVAWHYLQISLSLVIMLGFLGTLVAIFARLQRSPDGNLTAAHWLMELPLMIYFGWISVATIANTTALLVHFGWKGGPLSEPTWAIIMLTVAGLADAMMSLRYLRPAYGLVIAWAAWGIYRNQHEQSEAIGKAALLIIGFALVTALFGLVRRIRMERANRSLSGMA